MRTLVAIFFFILRARAEGWDDFTNNLATDLAPLIALFGEQATKQFLSESTSRLDNIIFAVAPLGILTAVVSVIRVLGSASLRAFVGRAQEGRGQAEAELCSSTSYDILECIVDDREVPKEAKRKSREHAKGADFEENNAINPLFYEVYTGGKPVRRPSAGIYKPQEYVQVFNLKERGKPQQQTQNGDAARMRFAPNPNLSLNVGIKKPGYVALYSAAILGCSLQASVLGYGAWAVYVKGLRKEGQSAVNPYFWLAVTGTGLLVVGMFLCARLIEQSTQESTFTFQKKVLWLQPGSQRVGDQTFEAFAYSTDLAEYTTSWKEERMERSEWSKRLSVWLAISTFMTGFVLQFTGLRGLHSSVAMYQFAATLIMALVRSLLRTQRLKEDENLLHDRELQSQVEGHELDWQAFRIEDCVKKAATESPPSSKGTISPFDDADLDNELYWSVVERPPGLKDARIATLKTELAAQLKARYKAELTVNEDGGAAWTSCPQTSAGNQGEWDAKCANALVEWIARVEDKDSTSTSQSHQPNDAKKLLSYRSRLSYLTNDDAPTTAQRWDLEVRDQATKLQAAIQSVANYIFSDGRQADIDAQRDITAAFCWAINCETARQPAVARHPVHLMVRRVRGQWRIDICQLEAVLGLWVWSIKMKEESTKKAKSKRNAITTIGEEVMPHAMDDDGGEACGFEEVDYSLRISRKVFTVIPGQDGEARKRAERELNIWVLREQRQAVYETLDKGTLADLETPKRAGKVSLTLSLPMATKMLMRSELEQRQDQQQQDFGLISVQTENPLLLMATQDIFTSFIDALASITSKLKGVNVVQNLGSDTVSEEVISTSKARPFLGLAHNHTERLVDLFIQAGLGSRDDALLSVSTPFHSRLLLPSLKKEYEQLRSHARKLREDGRWEQAENLLIALCDEARSDTQDIDASLQSEEFLWELGEFYRKAMRSTDPSRRSFGYQGVCNMLTMCTAKTDKTKEIRQNYSWVAVELARLHQGPDKVPEALQIEVKKNGRLPDAGMLLQDMMRFESAYPIGFVMAERFEKRTEEEKQLSGPQILIWAAQKGCKELVEDMLCAGVDVNVCDAKRRTPLSHACEQGHDRLSKDLVRKGAANIADEENCTPFAWAVKKGLTQLVLQFLEMNVDVGLKDKNERTPLSWAAGNGHEAVVKLLVKAGKADVNSEDVMKRTPLSWAVGNGYTAVVKLLLNTSKTNVESKDYAGRTLLSWAAGNGHEAVVKLLLGIGKANVELQDNRSWTPLLCAASNGHQAVVKLLLEIGKANVESNYVRGQTPLQLAASNGHEAVVKLLLEIGKAKVNATSYYGQRTALSFAAQGGHKAVVKLLLETGKANVHLRDGGGRTPLNRAEQCGHKEVVKLLLEAGKIEV